MTRSASLWRRARSPWQRVLTTSREREEAALEARLRRPLNVTRPRTIAFVAAEGGVGRTAFALATGSLLAERTSLRVLALDTAWRGITRRSLVAYAGASGYGSIASLSALDRVDSAASMRPFVSIHRSGVHVLSGSVPPAELAELIFLCQRFYDLVLVDTVDGVSSAATQAALACAGQVVVVTSLNWLTATATAAALESGLPGSTAIVNRVADRTGSGPACELLADAGASDVLTVRENREFARALACASFSFAGLQRGLRQDLRRVAIRMLAGFEDGWPKGMDASGVDRRASPAAAHLHGRASASRP